MRRTSPQPRTEPSACGMGRSNPSLWPMRLFRWFILRRVVHEPLRSGLTALGIALGVAVVVAIQLTNASSLAGFETALNTVSGRTSLEIVSAAGAVDELELPQLEWLRTYGE